MSHTIAGTETRPFSSPIEGADYNPAAHGYVCVIERCHCGASRRSNVNGSHAEIGPWDLPHKRLNVQAVSVTAADCRRYLEIAAGSDLGRTIILEMCGPEGGEAIIRAPHRGDDESTKRIARAVHAKLG